MSDGYHSRNEYFDLAVAKTHDLSQTKDNKAISNRAHFGCQSPTDPTCQKVGSKRAVLCAQMSDS
eukprot:188864-Amphidinium_carterae.1